MKISTIIKAGLHLSKLSLNLIFVWLTLGWRVRRASKAFEKELVKSGMPKEAAKRLAKRYSSLKDNVMRKLWNSVARRA